ncbi:MAG: primase C-terminal domain-containing protein [Ignavibacterium sp.]|nr:primase C-terminal domain-containing protein [Ignavibacterium sp.]
MYQERESYWVEVGTFYPTKRRNIWIRENELENTIKQLNKKGLFVSAYKYKEKEKENRNGVLFGDLYFDFDSENFEYVKKDCIRTISILRVIFKIDIDMIDIYFSGKKGIHIIVPSVILGIEEKEGLNDDFKCIAKKIKEKLTYQTLDTKIYDSARLLRFPNSIHEDTGLYKIPITEEELRTLNKEQIIELSKKPRYIKRVKPQYNQEAHQEYNNWLKDKKENKRTNIKEEKKITYTPPCIKYIWENGAGNGKRNNSLMALVSHFYQLGHPYEKALQWALQWNEKCNPPDKEKNVISTVQSVYQKGYECGCRFLKEISECFSDCKYYNK